MLKSLLKLNTEKSRFKFTRNNLTINNKNFPVVVSKKKIITCTKYRGFN